MDGTVTLDGPIRLGVVRIGFGWLPEFDWRRSHGVWDVRGDVIFEGSALIVYGVKISVGAYATLRFGDDVFVNADTRLSTSVGITIGAGSKISWENWILDDDAHHIDDRPPRAAITVGEHVWTGGRVMILKGVTLADGTIVGANSVVTRSITKPETLIAGSPVRELGTDLRWHH
jgi:acetyltransferase-like isoleucine patch superfamily enzyme